MRLFSIIFFLLLFNRVIFMPCEDIWAGFCGCADDGAGVTHVTGDAPWVADSISYQDVDYCINKVAKEGETVFIPAGNAVWAQPLVVNKALTIKGAGAGSSVIAGDIADPERAVIEYKSAGSTDVKFRLTGFTIDSKAKSIPLWIGISRADHYKGYVVSNVRVDNNNIVGGSTSIHMCGTVFGVVDNNLLNGKINNEEGEQLVAWNTLGSEFGGADNIYFEDNDITRDSSSASIFTSGHGSRYAARYNTITQTNRSINTFDVHGNMPGPSITNMVFEGYGNYINNTGWDGSLADLRGGKNLLFCNEQSDGEEIRAQIREEYDDDGFADMMVLVAAKNTVTITGATFPADVVYMNVRVTQGIAVGADRVVVSRDSPTTITITPDWDIQPDNTSRVAVYYTAGPNSGKLQKVNNSYIWNNRRSNGSLISAYVREDNFEGIHSVPHYQNDPASLAENREFWQQSLFFDGSKGVGCGTVANMPSNCLTGAGYWATDQPCNSLLGMVGRNPVNPVSGILYKCVANDTWDAYYTPYTYPHPLRNESDATKPEAPKSLNVK